MKRVEHSDGVLVALAAAALATTSYLITTRFADEWSLGARLAVSVIPAVLVLAVSIPVRVEDRPPPWLSALYAAGFALSLAALSDLAEVLGGSGDDLPSGTATWIGAVLAFGWGGVAHVRRSGLAALFAGASAVVAVVAAVEWIFSPEGLDTPRAVLAGCAFALLAGAFALRRARPRHAVALADVAGLAALAIALTFAVELFFGAVFAEDEGGESVRIAWGWELVVLAVSLALAGFAALQRAAGPGWIAGTSLVAFVVLAQDVEEASFVGWPLALAAITIVLWAAVLVRR